MNRYQRWGNKVEQRQERERYQRPPQHARVPLGVLQCVDCLRLLPVTHPAYLEERCGWCWNALHVAEGVEVYG